MKVPLALSALLVLCAPAQAHRMSGHDYRAGPHWCTWSAASVCAKWRANSGRYAHCDREPGNMSVACKRQRREDGRR
jgi:hypothetical protein